MKTRNVCPPYALAVLIIAGLLGIAVPAVALAVAIAGQAPQTLTPALLQQGEEDGEPAGQNKMAESMEKLRQVRARMEKEREELSSVMAEEDSILARMEALQKKLISSRDRLEKLEAQMAVTREESRLLESKIQELKLRADDLQAAMNRRLRAHYRFARTGLARVLFTADNVADLTRRMSYMDAVFRKDRKRLDDYAGLLQEWRKARDRLEQKKELYIELKKTVEKQQEELKSEKSVLNDLLESIRRERRHHQKALRELEAGKRRLMGMINSLEKTKHKKKAVESASRTVKKFKGFASRRGALCYPAAGPVKASFGKKVHPRFNTETMQNGVEIGASRGAPVKAVAPGVVRFAKWFRGYGNMVIVDHGKSYYTIYAHLASIRVGTGDSVKTGAVLGTVGDTGSMQGPSLYFEIRHHQNPVNPESWLGKCSL